MQKVSLLPGNIRNSMYKNLARMKIEDVCEETVRKREAKSFQSQQDLIVAFKLDDLKECKTVFQR
jgi:hypothetical protein